MPVKKSIIKKNSVAKTLTKQPKAAAKTELVHVDEKILPTKKPKKHIKIQTAEGWKRTMMRQHLKVKKSK